MYNVLVRYDYALRSAGRAGRVLQEEGLDRVVCQAPARGTLQSIRGEHLNTEASKGVFGVSVIVGFTTAKEP
jgi:hypothetical protein